MLSTFVLAISIATTAPYSVSCLQYIITDGDTIKCYNNGEYKMRLLGTDTPEIKQTCLNQAGKLYYCGEVAKAVLQNFIQGKALRCDIYKKDRYHRNLALCYANNYDVGYYLISVGWAVPLFYHNLEKTICSHYYSAQYHAAHNKYGMWAGKFVRPVDYRKALRNKIK